MVEAFFVRADGTWSEFGAKPGDQGASTSSRKSTAARAHVTLVLRVLDAMVNLPVITEGTLRLTVDDIVGHYTVGYAVAVARSAAVRRLCLFHLDPAHDDDEMDRLLPLARSCAGHDGVEVLLASEALALPN